MRLSKVLRGIEPVNVASYSEILGNVNEFGIRDQNVSHYLRLFSRNKNKVNFLHSSSEGKAWNYGALRKQVEFLSRNLLSLGMRPSERVLSFSSGCFENYLLQLACSLIGCIYVSVPPEQYSCDSLRGFLNQFQPQILHVCDKYQGSKEKTSSSFYDVLHAVIPELALSYPGQTVQFEHSVEFPYLKRCFISGRAGQEIKEEHKFNFLLPSVYAYHEDPLGRFNLLLHPDEPLLSLWNPDPPMEDKPFITYSHSHCLNAGAQFGHALGLSSGSRMSFLHTQSSSPIGLILAPFSALAQGLEVVLQRDNLLRLGAKDFATEINGQNLACFVGTRDDFERIFSICGSNQVLEIPKVALVECCSNEEANDDFLQRIKTVFSADEVIVFRGPIESCFMVTHRTITNSQPSPLPYTGLKVVGDRGTYDAKILSRGMRGNLKLRGPHVTPYYHSNAGLLTEFQDECGWIATSRDARINLNGTWSSMKAQMY